MKVAGSILLLSLVTVALGGNTFRRVNSERIKREDLPVPEQSRNVNDEEKISDEGWVQRPSEDNQPSSDDIPIEAEKPSQQAPQGNATSLENLQIGSVVVDATKAIAGAISTIAGGVAQATAGIVGMIYRPPVAIGNFTFSRESCKLRITDKTTKLYKDTQMNCEAMSRLIEDVEVQAQKIVDQPHKVNQQSEKLDIKSEKGDAQSQKVNDKSPINKASPDLNCIFIRTKPDTIEFEKRVDCELLQSYTQKYTP